jgi:Crp-like helix-turn-helix protein
MRGRGYDPWELRLYVHLELVDLPLGKVLYEPGDLLRHVYFATDSIVSLPYVMADGASAEIALVGNEGVAGVSLFMGGETTPSRAVVQSAGQTAVCNRHHSLNQQLCRWPLLSLDRLASNELLMTHELVANMPGVRRVGVTEVASKLQALGVIKYSRGKITVLDRQKLERLCCECCAVVKKETDRLLPHPGTWQRLSANDAAVGQVTASRGEPTTSAKCPKCERALRRVVAESITLDQDGTSLKGATYSCPYCGMLKRLDRSAGVDA